MTDQDQRPFTPRMFLLPVRGTRCDAMNALSPEVNLSDPDSPRFGSTDGEEPQRWMAIVLSEEELDILQGVAAAVAVDEEISPEGRYLGDRLNVLVKASIENFQSYEQRKADDVPASLPITA